MSIASSTIAPSVSGLPLEPGGLPPELVWPLSVERYHQMIEAGILTTDDPVELLEGCLVRKMPKHALHRFVNIELGKWLDSVLPSGYFTMSQDPITFSTSEPEPDHSVVRGQHRMFAKRHPQAGDVSLLVDVSDTTLSHDRGRKKRVYAKANIPQYWIINLEDRQIEVHSDPDPAAGDYRQQTVLGVKDDFQVVIDDKILGTLRLEQLLPVG